MSNSKNIMLERGFHARLLNFITALIKKEEASYFFEVLELS